METWGLVLALGLVTVFLMAAVVVRRWFERMSQLGVIRRGGAGGQWGGDLGGSFDGGDGGWSSGGDGGWSSDGDGGCSGGDGGSSGGDSGGGGCGGE